MANKTKLRPRALIAISCAAFLIVFAVPAFRTLSRTHGQAPAPAREETKRDKPVESAKPSQPFTVSNSSSALELEHDIDRQIDESKFARARWGVFVMSLRDRRILYARGVRRVRGDIVGDESYFRGDPLGDGWLWNDVQWYSGAEVSALSINDNAVSVTVTPASE